MKLSTKLVIISLTGFLVILAISFTGTLYHYKNVKDKQINKTVLKAKHNFEVLMEAKKKVWLTNALQVANNSEVINAVKEGNREKADKVLKQLGQVFKKNTGFKNVQVHLIDKDLKSFYKSWNYKSYGEKLSYSNGYRIVKETLKSAAAMEISSKGLRLKGLFPIKDDGRFIGIANFEGGLNSIKRTLKPNNIEFLYFMNKSDVNIAKSMSSKPDTAGYILNQKDLDGDFHSHIKKESVFKKVLENDYLLDNKYLTFKGKFKSFSGSGSGLYLLGMKTDTAMENALAEKELIFKLFIFLFSIFSILLVLIILFVRFNAVSAINKVVESMEDIAKRWFNAFIERINNIIVDISENAETVTAASSELKEVSDQMNDDLSNLSGKANTVAASSEEMSSNMNSVAAASSQASMNINNIAGAATQMQGTLTEISTNCERAKQTTDKASDQIKNATRRVEHLGTSAREVSQVIQVINDIAEQTNLLALNATIEAARAGEAGKGFAVVAGEIKSLAHQTAEGTEKIKKHINGIQNSTVETVEDVNNISSVISDFNDIVSTIVTAIEEQVISAKDVAMNISHASQGIMEVDENVSQSSHVSSEISKDIAGVYSVADDMSERSSRMNRSARDLSDLSMQLRDMISVFKITKKCSGIKDGISYNENNIQDLMPWGPRFQLGIKEIDNQHMELIYLVNRLHRAMKQKKAGTENFRILNELTEYTVYHFDFEEELFDSFNFPDTIEHKKAHRDLIKKVQILTEGLKEGKASLNMDLMEFLTDWLKNHILITDKKYQSFFKERL